MKAYIVLLIILAVILITIAVIAVFLSAHAKANQKAMQQTIDDSLKFLSERFHVDKKDAGAYAQIRIYGAMKFNTAQYAVSGIGNLSVMTTNMGFMQMVSFIITPFEKDMPLLSMDYMYMPNKRKTYTELYDLTPDKQTPEYQHILEIMNGLYETGKALADMPRSKAAWYDDLLTVQLYKSCSADQEQRVHDLFCDAVRRYADAADTLAPIADDEKAVKHKLIQEYSDNLIEKGGISTDVFKKALGAETTKDFFDKVFFGNSTV